MRIHSPLLGITLMLLACRLALAQEMSPQQVFKAVSPSVVVVNVWGADDELIASGSGIVVPSRKEKVTTIATNCHVVDEAPSGVVGVRSGDIWGVGRVVGKDVARDLCMVDAVMFDKEEVKKLPAVRIASSSWVEVGDPVYAVGAPQGLELSLSDGLISGFREYQGTSYIQTTSPISKGSSGGGLFDAQARLVGITTMYLKDAQALNFAVPAELIASVPEVRHQEQESENDIQPEQPPAQHASAASRWLYVAESNIGGRMFLDRKTVRRSGSDVTAWIKTEYSSPQTDGAGDEYDEASILMVFHCLSRQTSSLSFVQRLNGSVVWSNEQKSYEIQRRSVHPDTTGEALYELACELRG